jgi:hypothetical protein
VFLLQTVLFAAPVQGAAIAVMSFAPQKLLRSDFPVVFFAPGMNRQSNAIEKVLAGRPFVL